MQIMVRDVMKHGVDTVNVETGAKEAFDMLLSSGHDYLPVVDEFGESCGALTVQDYLNNIGTITGETIVEDIMDSKVVTIFPSASLERAVETLKEENTNHLLIIHNVPNNPRRPVGIVSAKDIVKAKLEQA